VPGEGRAPSRLGAGTALTNRWVRKGAVAGTAWTAGTALGGPGLCPKHSFEHFVKVRRCSTLSTADQLLSQQSSDRPRRGAGRERRVHPRTPHRRHRCHTGAPSHCCPGKPRARRPGSMRCPGCFPNSVQKPGC